MKQLKTRKLALVYAGCFLGAGYVSGQEIWQYFGSFGVSGLLGLAAAMALLFMFGVMILRTAQITGKTAADEIAVSWDLPAVKTVMSAMEIVMMFAVVAVMSAGVGALAEQMLGVPAWCGSLVFCAVTMACALMGLQAVVSAFSVSVPLLVGATAVLCAWSLAKNGVTLPAARMSDNALLGTWLPSAVNFACYNVFLTIALIAPFGPYVKRRRTAAAGIGLGTAMLAVIALGVMLCLFSLPEAAEAELPTLYAASQLTPAGAWVYAVLLLLAMFGTALSSLVAVGHYLSEKVAVCKRRGRLVTVIISAAAFGGSLFGFGDLIGTLYPIFGYGSVAFLILLAVSYFRLRKKQSASI